MIFHNALWGSYQTKGNMSFYFACKSVLMRGSGWYRLPGPGDLDGNLGPDYVLYVFASVNFAKCNFSELIV